MVDHQKFQDFDAVIQLYVNFKRLLKAEAPAYQAHNVSALQDCGDGRQGRWGHVSGGRGGLNARILGLVPQDEIDKVTTVENKYYPASVYNKFTLAKKAKCFQLRNPMRIPGTGPSGRKTQQSLVTVVELITAIGAASAAALATSELTAVATKRTAAEDGWTNDYDQIVATNPVWGRNRDNPTVAGCQGIVPKKQNN